MSAYAFVARPLIYSETIESGHTKSLLQQHLILHSIRILPPRRMALTPLLLSDFRLRDFGLFLHREIRSDNYDIDFIRTRRTVMFPEGNLLCVRVTLAFPRCSNDILVRGLLSCKGFRRLQGRLVAEVEGRETSGGGRAGGKFWEGGADRRWAVMEDDNRWGISEVTGSVIKRRKCL